MTEGSSPRPRFEESFVENRVLSFLVTSCRIMVCLFILLATWSAGQTLPVATCLELTRNMELWGALAPLGTIVLSAWAMICFFPDPLLSVAAGSRMGPLYGLVWSLAGSVIGATIAYACGAFVARQRVAAIWADSPQFKASQKALHESGFIWCLSAFLVPFVPAAGVSYLMGGLGLRWRPFFWASLWGLLPAKLIFLYLGYSIGCSLVDESGVGAWDEVALPTLLVCILAALPLSLQWLFHRRESAGGGLE